MKEGRRVFSALVGRMAADAEILRLAAQVSAIGARFLCTLPFSSKSPRSDILRGVSAPKEKSRRLPPFFGRSLFVCSFAEGAFLPPLRHRRLCRANDHCHDHYHYHSHYHFYFHFHYHYAMPKYAVACHCMPLHFLRQKKCRFIWLFRRAKFHFFEFSPFLRISAELSLISAEMSLISAFYGFCRKAENFSEGNLLTCMPEGIIL